MRTLAALAVIGLLLLYVWERVDIVRVGYETEHLKAQKIILQREHDELRVRVSTLTAPDRIARAASERLGMMPPQQGQVVLVRLEPQAPVENQPPRPEIRLAKHDPAERHP
jgi:cell division protein FtsL